MLKRRSKRIRMLRNQQHKKKIGMRGNCVRHVVLSLEEMSRGRKDAN